MGLTIEWQAALDMRTRHDHRMMHGQRRAVNEPFVTPEGFSILYPADCTGDSDAPQKEIWNCRCTLLSWVKGFEGDTVKSSPKMGDMSFEEWQQAKAHPDTKADREQYERYRKTLGKNAPKSYEEFRNIKYYEPYKWEELKGQYKDKRSAGEKTSNIPNAGRISGDLTKYRDSLDRFSTLSGVLKEQSEQVNYILDGYTDKESKWSGNTIVRSRMKALGRKQWNCDITLRDDASIKTVVHEHLHARSISYFNPEMYLKYRALEEGAVEFFAEAICAANGVSYIPTYTQYTGPLRAIGTLSGAFKDEYLYAKSLFDIPLDQRYNYVEGLVNQTISNPYIGTKRKNKITRAFNELKRVMRK